MIPFHNSIQIDHHRRSDRNDTLRRTWWCACLMPARSSNIRRIKVFPGFMTRLACARRPTNDSSSRLVHERLSDHLFTKCCSSLSFSTGRQISHDSESISKPRKVSFGVGPSNLSQATGTPADQGSAAPRSLPRHTDLTPGHLPKENRLDSE